MALCWVLVCSNRMGRAERPAEECPGDPTHRSDKQKPNGLWRGGVCVCVCILLPYLSEHSHL